MKPTLGVLLLATSSILAGCATQSPKIRDANNVSPAGTDAQCHAVNQTGSLFRNTVCLTQSERDAQKAAMDDLQNTVERNTNACGKASSCAD